MAAWFCDVGGTMRAVPDQVVRAPGALALVCAWLLPLPPTPGPAQRERPSSWARSVPAGWPYAGAGGHAAQRDEGQVGAAARAQHYQARVVILGGMQDGCRDVPELVSRISPLALMPGACSSATILETTPSPFAVPGVHLDLAEWPVASCAVCKRL